MANKKDRIYFPDKIGSEKDFPEGMDKSSFRIVTNQFIDTEYDSKYRYFLMLELTRAENKSDKPSYVYSLKSIKPIYQFLCDNEIDLRDAKEGPIEELLGNEIIGFTPKDANGNENKYRANVESFVKAIAIKENPERKK